MIMKTNYQTTISFPSIIFVLAIAISSLLLTPEAFYAQGLTVNC